VAGKGDGLIARAMRGMAEREGVPIIRNVPLARALHEQVPVEAVVPEDMFAAVAEVILTARRLRDEAARGETLDPVDLTDEVEGQGADPGEGAAVEAAPVRSGPLFPAMPDDGVASSPETQ
jgi:type III secretion protein U